MYFIYFVHCALPAEYGRKKNLNYEMYVKLFSSLNDN